MDEINNLKLEFYRPKSDLLKQYIEGYYFISASSITKAIRYYTFPNNFTIISVSLGAHIELNENSIVVSNSGNDSVCADFVTRYTAPIEVCFHDVPPEVTLYFKPGGIHHFIKDAAGIFQQASGVGFNPFPDFYPEMKKLLQMKDRSLQIEVLEQYWLAKFIKKDMRRIEAVLLDMDTDLSVSAIAAKHELSRQHLNNLFVKNIGKPPSEYRKIQRFRAAIRHKHLARSLTHLTYQSLFYDQSHMIRDFKKLTRTNPHNFFKHVDVNKENVWLFM